MSEQLKDVPFDPDFDSPEQQNNAAGVSPRLAFWAGVVAAVLAFGTVGFVVLLIVTLKG